MGCFGGLIILVKGTCVMKHRLHIGHFANIPTANILVKGISPPKHPMHNTAMTLHNMDSTLRGWAKLDTVAGESAIQNNVTWGIANYTDATARQ
jgi:hypothetical protein